MLVVSPAHATGWLSPLVMSMAPWTLVWMPGGLYHPDRYVAVSALGHHVVITDHSHGTDLEGYCIRATEVVDSLNRLYAHRS